MHARGAAAHGILLAESVAKPYTTELFAAIGLHRVWDRAELVMAE